MKEIYNEKLQVCFERAAEEKTSGKQELGRDWIWEEMCLTWNIQVFWGKIE